MPPVIKPRPSQLATVPAQIATDMSVQIPSSTGSTWDGTLPFSPVANPSTQVANLPLLPAQPGETAPVTTVTSEKSGLILSEMHAFLISLGLPVSVLDSHSLKFEFENGIYLFCLDRNLPFYFSVHANHLVPDKMFGVVSEFGEEDRKLLKEKLSLELGDSYKMVKYQVSDDGQVNATLELCANTVKDLKPWFSFCLGLMKAAISRFMHRYGESLNSQDFEMPSLMLH